MTVDAVRHERLIGEMQALRGGVYLEGGYLTPEQLSAGGRHQTPEDEKSWHLLITDARGQVSSCGWYLNHENTASVDDLRVRNCPLARVAEWREKLYAAVESEIARARRAGLYYAELGGWAVSKERRCSSEGLMLALAGYGLSRLSGRRHRHHGCQCNTRIVVDTAPLGRFVPGGGGHDDTGLLRPAIQHDDRTLAVRLEASQRKFNGLIDLAKSSLARVPVVARSRGRGPCRLRSKGRWSVRSSPPRP